MEERNWRWTDGYLLTWANWVDTKPNGDTSENCMIRMTSGEWDDDLCSNSYQFYCENVTGLKAIACIGHGKMKMNRFIIEHLCLLRVVVVICDISE